MEMKFTSKGKYTPRQTIVIDILASIHRRLLSTSISNPSLKSSIKNAKSK